MGQNLPAQLQGQVPVHLCAAEDGPRGPRAIDHRPVFAQVVELVRHRGKQLPQAGVLPPAGGTEADAPLPQAGDLFKNSRRDGVRPILQQGSVDVADHQLDHGSFLPFSGPAAGPGSPRRPLR